MWRNRTAFGALAVLSVAVLLSVEISGCAFWKGSKKTETTEASAIDEKYSREVKLVPASTLKDDVGVGDNYRIDVDDLLEISVWQIEELHREVVVRPDGKISYPLIGDVQAKGRTIEELRQDIVDKIRLYIKVPQVSVTIKEFGGKKAVVLGEVENPGVIRFTSPIKISEAIGLAGDFLEDDTATKSTVYVIRDLPGDSPTIIVANVSDLLYKGDLREDIFIKAGDIIYIQKSAWTSFKEFMGTTFQVALNWAETYYGVPLWKKLAYVDTVDYKGRKYRYKTGFK